MSITNGYCTLAQVKSALSITDSTDDTALELAVNAASRQIDNWCGQRFWIDGTATVREFYVDSRGALDLDLTQNDVYGIATTTGLVVKVDQDGDGVFETTLTSGTDFLLNPPNAADLIPVQPYTGLSFGLNTGAIYGLPASYGRPVVQVTAKWGWPAVPDDVTQACVLQAAQLFKSKDAVFGVAAFGEFGPLRVRSALNPIAEGLLAPYQRVAVG